MDAERIRELYLEHVFGQRDIKCRGCGSVDDVLNDEFVCKDCQKNDE